MHIKSDDIIINKIGIIQRSLNRALEEYSKNPNLNQYTELDALILNLERACQAAIDLAMHIVSVQRLGVPQSSSDAFRLLESHKLIEQNTAKSLLAMVGFRNIAIHEYQKLNTEIIHSIMKADYKVFIQFCNQLGYDIKQEYP
ncbi:MAG: DUF86 domain-containing protein [Leptospiraceae bacterium]|nr:DUF86 domain-containing protein [Leptospiraceae bacterium]